MFKKFTDQAYRAMACANQEALRFNHNYIGTEHLLLGLASVEGVSRKILKDLNLTLDKLRLELDKFVRNGPDMQNFGRLPQTPRTKKVIEYAIEESRAANSKWVGTGHLLLGILREHDGVAAQVFRGLRLKLEDIRERVVHELAQPTANALEGIPKPTPKIAEPAAIDYFILSVQVIQGWNLLTVVRGNKILFRRIPVSVFVYDPANNILTFTKTESFWVPSLRVAKDGEIEKITNPLISAE